METQISKKIDYRFKIIYTVAITMIVAGHCGGGGIDFTFSGWFPYYELHLALFLFSSGYFYKKTAENNVGNYIFKKIKTLIIPLYIYNFFYGLIVQLLRLKNFQMGASLSVNSLLIQPIITGHQFIYNLGSWFVIPLFMIEIYNILLRKFFIKMKISECIFFVINIFLGSIGNYLSYKGYNQGIWLPLVRMLHFIPYYGLGIFYKYFFEKYEKKIPTRYLFLVIFILKFLIFLTGRNPTFTPSWCNDFSKYPFLPIIVAYLGIAFWLRLATVLEPVIGKNKYLNLIADNTYSIMMNHFIFFMVVKTFFGFISKFTKHCSDFDWIRYKSDIWYYYIPRGMYQNGIIYLIAGIMGPILIQLLINKIKAIVSRKFKL